MDETVKQAADARRVAIVTGAGRGIGRGVALGLATDGWAVACAARTHDEIAETVRRIQVEGGEALGVVTDVRDEESLGELADAVAHQYGRTDLLVANAGAASEPIVTLDASVETFRSLFETNVIGVLNTVRAVAPIMRSSGGGSVLVMGSGTGHSAAPRLAAYGVTKAGVSMLVKVLALELRADGISVNEIVPGPVRTTMTGYGADDGRPDASTTNEDVWASIGEWIKDPTDVAALVCYLAGLPANGPTGQLFSLAGRLL